MTASVRQIRPRAVSQAKAAFASLAAKSLPLFEAKPVRLAPIAWGKPDPALGRAVCRRILAATPPLVLPFDARTDARMRRALLHLGVPLERSRPAPRSPVSRTRPMSTTPEL